jgi:hypothetical protein
MQGFNKIFPSLILLSGMDVCCTKAFGGKTITFMNCSKRYNASCQEYDLSHCILRPNSLVIKRFSQSIILDLAGPYQVTRVPVKANGVQHVNTLFRHGTLSTLLEEKVLAALVFYPYVQGTIIKLGWDAAVTV